MKPIRNILYFADGDLTMNPALERAISLARSSEGRLTVMDVISNQPSPAAIRIRLGLGMNEIVKRYQEQELQALLTDLPPLTYPVRIDVRIGWGFIEAIRAVVEQQHDLLIKPARHGCHRPLSSNDMHVLRKCPCPVWIDRSSDAVPYRTVLAAVDPISGNDDCADKVIDMAARIARGHSARLAVVHAWELYGESMLRDGGFNMGNVELEELLEETRIEHSQAVAQLLQRHSLAPPEADIHIAKGNPTEVISRIKEKIGADLVVMGTVGRTGIPGFIIGNTAEEVLQRSGCSVLAVKPSGFVSPVTPH
ncbi:universal stress protein [Motiliproteus sp. SC1-56]|uniref:universal stress protein n=1 Tax=Motiliproteus sp. SC1-56 TaxID=2799565 RepID=UPI001A8CDD38|nr:universal stress protein [Motiliproteus sp. SC1-56]